MRCGFPLPLFPLFIVVPLSFLRACFSDRHSPMWELQKNHLFKSSASLPHFFCCFFVHPRPSRNPLSFLAPRREALSFDIMLRAHTQCPAWFHRSPNTPRYPSTPSRPGSGNKAFSFLFIFQGCQPSFLFFRYVSPLAPQTRLFSLYCPPQGGFGCRFLRTRCPSFFFISVLYHYFLPFWMIK